MTNISKFLIGAAFAALVLPSSAMAASVTGSSGGSFDNISSCNSNGSQCRIVDTGYGDDTQVQWGSDSSSQYHNPSTLTAVDLSIGTFSTAQNDVRIAELTWFNAATDSNRTDNNFNVQYLLSISFASPTPNGGPFGETFNLNIQSPTNATGDSIGAFTVPELSALSFTLPGWTVSDFKYSVTGGSAYLGSCPTVSGSSNWCNPEENTSHLYITADFTPNATSVPEPMTLSLFGAGLAGAAVMRLRRRKKA